MNWENSAEVLLELVRRQPSVVAGEVKEHLSRTATQTETRVALYVIAYRLQLFCQELRSIARSIAQGGTR